MVKVKDTVRYRGVLRRRLLRLWSEAVRRRDGCKCIYCGSTEKPQAHHLCPKSCKDSKLRYDIMNGVTLCSLHHKYSNKISAHKSPIIFAEWLRNNRFEQYNYVLDNYNEEIDLDNLEVLLSIEKELNE